jgi:Domain of unknown function (DUF4926)
MVNKGFGKQFYEQEVVRLTRDIKSSRLMEGDRGTILAIHESNPVAYEVEFCDRDGKSLALLTLTEDDISRRGIVEISDANFLLALHLLSVYQAAPKSTNLTVQIEVEIRASSFKAALMTYVRGQELIDFERQLRAVRDKRLKRAKLNTLTPGEFELSVEIAQHLDTHDFENWSLHCSLWDATYSSNAHLTSRFDLNKFLLQTLMRDFQKLLQTIQES